VIISSCDEDYPIICSGERGTSEREDSLENLLTTNLEELVTGHRDSEQRAYSSFSRQPLPCLVDSPSTRLLPFT
jgi:hypothetical protein